MVKVETMSEEASFVVAKYDYTAQEPAVSLLNPAPDFYFWTQDW